VNSDMGENAQLSTLRRTPKWSPLSDSFPAAKILCDRVYHIGGDFYVHAQPYNAALKQGLPGAPFVTKLYWAENAEAMTRAASGDVSVYSIRGVPGNVPVGLLPGLQPTYSDVLGFLRLRHAESSESAVYNSSGVFLHKTIRMEGVVLCFHSLDISERETPYLAEIALPS
jgi:hypothetical protein